MIIIKSNSTTILIQHPLNISFQGDGKVVVKTKDGDIYKGTFVNYE